MTDIDIASLLSKNSYPGRGIIIGHTENGQYTAIAYWIMGRSENSRNRIFTATEDGIQTEARDPSKVTDPSLIIYHPVRCTAEYTVVTNGDQTDTICSYLANGKTFYDALKTRTFEPDAPNYTPRISGIVRNGGTYTLSILKSGNGDPNCCYRQFFDYDHIQPGVGHYIHTYLHDGNPLPSFKGEPETVSLFGVETAEQLADMIWGSLDEMNKVSLFVRFIHIVSGKTSDVIKNKY